MPRTKVQEQSADFLIAEFNALQERAINLEHVKANHINFFFLFASALIAGGASLYDSLITSGNYPIIIGGVAFLVAFIGFITLDYSLSDSITIVAYYQVSGRIRRYFVDKDDEIENYVPFAPNDDRPRYRAKAFSFRGSERILLILNSLSLSLCITVLATILFPFLNWVIYFVIAFLALTLFWFLQHIFIKKKLHGAEKSLAVRIKFKSTDDE